MTCLAHGCRIPGGIKEGNAWICRFHFGRDVHDWPRITEAVNALAGLNSLILKVSREPITHAQFAERMTESMRNRHPQLVPNDGESIGRWLQRADAYIDAATQRIHERLAA